MGFKGYVCLDSYKEDEIRLFISGPYRDFCLLLQSIIIKIKKMSVLNKAPSSGRGRSVKRNVQHAQENSVQLILDEHKKSLGEVMCLRIDARTIIELPAHLSEEEQAKRIKAFMKNTNYKLPK